MSAIPYMPLYVADYLADAAHLTTEEHGAYLLLIMTYWQRGKPLPAEPARLANIARLPNERWTDVQRTLEQFFNVKDGTWVHNRIEAELQKFRNKSEKAKKAGQASGDSRKGAKTNSGPTDVKQRTNGRSTDVQRTLNHTDTDTDTDTDKNSNSPPDNSEIVAARGPDEIAGLNGSTSLIVSEFARWLNHNAPDFQSARTMIGKAVALYGPNAVRDGFADMQAKHADGEVRVPTVKAFYGFVQRAKDGRVRISKREPTASEKQAERTRLLLAEVDAELAATAGAPN